MTNNTPAPIGADAWMDPGTRDVINAERKQSWLTHYGIGGKEKAATYSVPLVRAALASAAQPVDAITASEAVFAFAAWLTCGDGSAVFGGAHDAAPAAELVSAFIASQGLTPPRDDYHLRLRPYPEAAPKAVPAAQGDARLWCVHVQGPDDVHAMPTRADALERANELNELFGQHPYEEGGPIMRAVVIEWPHSAGAHAQDLAAAARAAKEGDKT